MCYMNTGKHEMAKAIAPLNVTQIKNAKPKTTDYVLSDGDGLYLIVRPSGTKNFQFKYSHPMTKKRLSISLGAFPDLGLADAREKTRELRKQVTSGVDPSSSKREQKAAELTRLATTLRSVAEGWIDIKRTRVTDDYAEDIWRSLECHVFPKLGDRPITDINAPETIKILSPLRVKGSLETVKRICQRLNEIMIYATNIGLITHNPIAGIKAAFPLPQKKSQPTIEPSELPDFLQALRLANLYTPTRCLIEFQLHTMSRPSEAAGALWSEVNWEEKTWEISAERMKMRRKHVVPLSNQLISLLEYMHKYSGHRQHIFPNVKKPLEHMSPQTANMAIRRMGYGGRLVAHGLRSLASTILNENEFNPDWIEAALAHADENTIRGTYNRALYLEQRRGMMQWWSDYIKNNQG